ncbi:hypothetical protein B0H14DRAFT_2609841 [Mycena olivaceomarginata]|nr:hypothetical protein B0H14DRAFT_2609841 [Mycena olivaceomarginata]
MICIINVQASLPSLHFQQATDGYNPIPRKPSPAPRPSTVQHTSYPPPRSCSSPRTARSRISPTALLTRLPARLRSGRLSPALYRRHARWRVVVGRVVVGRVVFGWCVGLGVGEGRLKEKLGLRPVFWRWQKTIQPISAEQRNQVQRTIGKGKASATAEELESAKVVARDWRSAVRHHREKHWQLPTAWYMLSDTDAAAARVQEAVVIETSNQRSKALVQGSSDDGTDSGNDVEMVDEDGPATSTSENKDPDEQTQEAHADISTTVASPGRGLPSQLPEATFSCAHCIDTPREPQPMDLKGMFLHLRIRHQDLTPRLNDNYYRSLAAPEIYTGNPFPAPVLNMRATASPDGSNKRGGLRRTGDSAKITGSACETVDGARRKGAIIYMQG